MKPFEGDETIAQLKTSESGSLESTWAVARRICAWYKNVEEFCISLDGVRGTWKHWGAMTIAEKKVWEAKTQDRRVNQGAEGVAQGISIP